MTERRIFWLVVLAGLGGLVYALGSTLTPFIVCLVLAYMLDPLVDMLEKHGLGRNLAAFLVCAVAIVLFLALFTFLVPLIVSQAIALAKAMPDALVWLQKTLDSYLSQPSASLEWLMSMLNIENPADVQQKLMAEVRMALQKLGSAIFQDTTVILRAFSSRIGAISNSLSIMLLIPFILFYLLRDWDRLVMQVRDVLPRSKVASAQVLGLRCGYALSGFFRGQILVMAFLGLFYGTGLALMGLPFGFLIGFFTGVLSFIPYVGMVIGFAVAEILALVHFGLWPQPVIVASIFFAGQVIESSFLTPKLIGESIQLHPVWIIFGLLAGGNLFGFAGLLFAIPVLAILGVIVRFMFEQYQSSNFYEDHD